MKRFEYIKIGLISQPKKRQRRQCSQKDINCQPDDHLCLQRGSTACGLAEREVTSDFQCGTTRRIQNTSALPTTLEFVNSWGVHCFFLHLHLLRLIHEIFACLNFLCSHEQLLLSLNALDQAVILLLPLFSYALEPSLMRNSFYFFLLQSLYPGSVENSVDEFWGCLQVSRNIKLFHFLLGVKKEHMLILLLPLEIQQMEL